MAVEPWPAPPARWAAGLALFTLTRLASVLAGGQVAAGLQDLANPLYLPAGLPLAWLAFNLRPRSRDWLPLLWGLGLIAAAGLTLQEGGWRLICPRAKAQRAKAHLGVIELGAVPGQLFPVLVGAPFTALLTGRKKAAAFFGLALAAAGFGFGAKLFLPGPPGGPHIEPVDVPVYRRRFRRPGRILAVLALVAALFAGALAGAGEKSRFTNLLSRSEAEPLIADPSGSIRLTLWRHGVEVFLAHPLFGGGADQFAASRGAA